MNVKVKLLGVFRGLSGRSQLSIEVDEPAVMSKLVEKLAESFSPKFKRALVAPELDDPRPNTLILVNGREISVLHGLETEICDGDEVVLIPVSHGG
ncbi:MAG: MoaD/ThiS family protein [Candidatus Bathyarchaeota archaeon]|nr:MAG: MoaD/ThiS family protein [Candidatus Bathyarchaeota archaeon]